MVLDIGPDVSPSFPFEQLSTGEFDFTGAWWLGEPAGGLVLALQNLLSS